MLGKQNMRAALAGSLSVSATSSPKHLGTAGTTKMGKTLDEEKVGGGKQRVGREWAWQQLIRRQRRRQWIQWRRSQTGRRQRKSGGSGSCGVGHWDLYTSTGGDIDLSSGTTYRRQQKNSGGQSEAHQAPRATLAAHLDDATGFAAALVLEKRVGTIA